MELSISALQQSVDWRMKLQIPDLLSPELAAGIRRVKSAKQLRARTGNWLTQDQARLLLQKADGDDLRSVRDLAMISVAVGCAGLSSPRLLLKECVGDLAPTDKARPPPNARF